MSEQTEQLVEEKAIGDVDSVEEQSVEEQPVEEQSAGVAEDAEDTAQTAEAETTTATEADAVETPTASQTTDSSTTQTADAEASATADSPTASGEAESSETEPAASDADAEQSEDGADDSADDSDADDSDTDEDGGKRVVRMLAVGQEVEGEVKRITDFGAFVDIGVGRDGLLHISELSVQRVGKVSDVLKEGQTVTVWIKDLDRERNRISLTLISPDTKTIRDLEKGEIVEGTVTRILPYGAFIDIGVGRDALLHVREMSEGYVKRPEDVVTVGETLEARIVELSRRRNRIDLSLKGLRPEAEAEALPQEAEEAFQEDPYEDVEVLSPMELAFKRAMEASEDEMPSGKRDRRRKKGQRRNNRSLQDEIIERTLGNRKE